MPDLKKDSLQQVLDQLAQAEASARSTISAIFHEARRDAAEVAEFRAETSEPLAGAIERAAAVRFVEVTVRDRRGNAGALDSPAEDGHQIYLEVRTDGMASRILHLVEDHEPIRPGKYRLVALLLPAAVQR